jgi:hypothetical protein
MKKTLDKLFKKKSQPSQQELQQFYEKQNILVKPPIAPNGKVVHRKTIVEFESPIKLEYSQSPTTPFKILRHETPYYISSSYSSSSSSSSSSRKSKKSKNKSKKNKKSKSRKHKK